MISETHEREVVVSLPIEQRFIRFLKEEIEGLTSILLLGNVRDMMEYRYHLGKLHAYQKTFEIFSRYHKEL
jgi:hypothetical protein